MSVSWQQDARVLQLSFRVGILDCAESTVDDLGVFFWIRECCEARSLLKMIFHLGRFNPEGHHQQVKKCYGVSSLKTSCCSTWGHMASTELSTGIPPS